MEFLEKDLETIIWESDKNKLTERGLEIRGVLKRQLRIGNYGVADLVSFDKQFHDYYDGTRQPCLLITVYELKKDMIGVSAFLQAVGYCKGIKTYLNKKKSSLRFRFEIVLIGKSIDTLNQFTYLEDMLENYSDQSYGKIHTIDFYTYNYGVEGLNFQHKSGYDLIDKGF